MSSFDRQSAKELLQQAVQKQGKLLNIIGFVFIALGIYALIAPTTFALGIEKVLGWTLFFAAVTYFAHAFLMRRWQGVAFDLLNGLILALVAFILLSNPLSGVMSLGLIMAVLFGFDGVMKGIRVFKGELNTSYQVALALSALLSIVIALLMLWDLPTAAPIFLSVIVGINLILNGFGLLALVKAFR
ncbi:DUF308 domain-containing protein [Marinomonas sp. THO17]|uniref:HdeD family acid-resistance protein n=1 Tax=Marinomonas sp. THO17 TaxID=3149048 RepID=UPI00336BFD79